MALPDAALPAADDAPGLAWHADSAEGASRRLGVDQASGLSDEEAAARLARHGPNRLTERPGKPAWRRFAAQLGQPLVLVLIAAGLDGFWRGEGYAGATVVTGLGVIFLLGNLGIMALTAWNLLLRLWPVLLIAFGLDMALGHDRPWAAAAGRQAPRHPPAAFVTPTAARLGEAGLPP